MSLSTIPGALVQETSKLVAARLGLEFPPPRWMDLERGMAAAAAALGHRDASSCMRWWCASSPTRKEIEALAVHLTVGETYFFRDVTMVEALQNRVLPDLIEERRGNRRLRLWSAGCASGEEPYSLAMLLDRLLPEQQEWNITILATDINVHALEKARRGVYGDWSFRGTPAWARAAYFQKRAGAEHELAQRIRRRVSFHYLNLAEDCYPDLATNTNAMDIVLCRNVLMYFGQPRVRRVVDNLFRALVDGGWLIVSPSELSQSLFSEFATFQRCGAILYRKTAERNLPPAFWEDAAWTSNDGSPREEPTAQPSLLSPVSVEPKEQPLPPTVVGVPAVEYRNEQAMALCRAGRYTEARHTLETWLEKHGADAQAAALLARVCANEGRLEDALRWCDRALGCDKLQSAYHYLRAVILEESGRGTEAAAALRAALYLDQRFVLAHFALSRIASRLGNMRESKRHRRAACALLQAYRADQVLPESEGITAGRLAAIVAHQESFA